MSDMQLYDEEEVRSSWVNERKMSVHVMLFESNKDCSSDIVEDRICSWSAGEIGGSEEVIWIWVRICWCFRDALDWSLVFLERFERVSLMSLDMTAIAINERPVPLRISFLFIYYWMMFVGNDWFLE